MVRARRCGFTLIELLVVMAVIAVLTGILLPALGGARRSARAIQCASNLKQIVLAWQVYADNYGGMACPSYEFRGTTEWAWDFVVTWGSPGTWDYGFLGRYVREGRINTCPSFHPSTTWGRPYTGYAYNATYIGGDVIAGIPPARVSRVRHPSRTVVFADSGHGNPVVPDNYLRAPSDRLFWKFHTGKVHYRHDGSANVAYADGHVAAVREKYRVRPQEPEVGALSPDDSAYDLD